MSDGTTGIQVAPIPTESEMASIRQIFTNVANALVRASELAQQVTDLEARFSSLNQDHMKVMARNDELTQSLHEVRSQRDDGARLLDETANNLRAAQASITDLTHQVEFGKTEIDRLNAKLKQVNDEAAHYAEEADKHERRASEAEAKLKAIHQTLGIPEVAAKPEPTPTPEPTQAQPEPYTPPVNPEPRPLSQEEAAPRTEQGPEVDFTKPYHWDPATNRWVND